MKDDSPRIFRTLEQSAGRDGFDTIVGAAVASYGSLRSPSENQARDFARLVVPLWSKIAPDTRRSLGAALSKSPRVPREIVERLMEEPVEVSAPFLLASPALGAADLKTLAESRDSRLRKLISGRLSAGEIGTTDTFGARVPATPAINAEPTIVPAADHLLATTDLTPRRAALIDSDHAIAGKGKAQPDHGPRPAHRAADDATPASTPDEAGTKGIANELAGRQPSSPAQHPEPQAAAPDRASPLRETLRRLALTGRRLSVTVPPGTVATLRDLVAFAVRQDTEHFYAALGSMLELRRETILQIADEEAGERLATALKALGASSADALTVLMMMKPSIGLDVQAFERMTRTYRALKSEDCAEILRGTRRRPQVAAPALQPQYQDLEPLARQAPRAAFGRRTTRPGASSKDSKTG